MATDYTNSENRRLSVYGESARMFNWDRSMTIMQEMIAAAEQCLKTINPTSLASTAEHGWPLAAAHAATHLGIPVTIINACQSYRTGFSPAVDTLYHTTLANADRLLTTDQSQGDWTKAVAHWLMQNSDLILVCWNGARTGRTFNVLRQARKLGLPMRNAWLDLPIATQAYYGADPNSPPTIAQLDGRKEYRRVKSLPSSLETGRLRIITGLGRSRHETLRAYSYALRHGLNDLMPCHSPKGDILLVGAIGNSLPDGQWAISVEEGRVPVARWLDELDKRGIAQIFLAVENPHRTRLPYRKDVIVAYTIQAMHVPQQSYTQWFTTLSEERHFAQAEQKWAPVERHRPLHLRMEIRPLTRTDGNTPYTIDTTEYDPRRIGHVYDLPRDTPGTARPDFIKVEEGPLQRTIICMGLDVKPITGERILIGNEVLIECKSLIGGRPWPPQDKSSAPGMLRGYGNLNGLTGQVLRRGTINREDSIVWLRKVSEPTIQINDTKNTMPFEDPSSPPRPPAILLRLPKFIHTHSGNKPRFHPLDKLQSNLRLLLASKRKHKRDGAAFPFHYDLGLCRWRLYEHHVYNGIKASPKNMDDITESFQAAARFNMKDETAIFGLGLCYLQGERIEDSIREFKRAIKINPLRPIYWISLAHAYFHLRDDVQALSTYERVLKVDPLDTVTYLRTANIHLEHEDFRQALKHIRQANKLEPGNPRILALLGWANYICGHTARSRKAYRASFDIPTYDRSSREWTTIEFDQGNVLEPARRFFNILSEASIQQGRLTTKRQDIYDTAIFLLRVDREDATPFIRFLKSLRRDDQKYEDKIYNAMSSQMFDSNQHIFPAEDPYPFGLVPPYRIGHISPQLISLELIKG